MKNQLISCINSLKSNLKNISFDEAATKQAVVLRLLSFLGWDTFNIDEVTPEYSVRSRGAVQRVDYSLRLNRVNKVFIEVKKIAEELEDHQEQLLNYSFQEGVKLSILTNGVTWWFYLPLNEGSWEQRRFYSIDLLQQKSEDVAQKFIDFLSKDNIINSQAIRNAESIYRSQQRKNTVRDALPKAWNKIVSDPDELLVELLIETAEKLCGYRAEIELVEKFLSKYKDNWLISDITTPSIVSPPKRKRGRRKTIQIPQNYTGKNISSFSFKGKTYEVRFYRDMLITLCDIFVSTHNKDFSKVLGIAGRKRPYFTRNANELRKPEKIAKTNIYVETNLNANTIVKICFNILSVFDYPSRELRINTQNKY